MTTTTPKAERCAEWGHWGITLYTSEPSACYGSAATAPSYRISFPCGVQGPVDGHLGSPTRQRYHDLIEAWKLSGTVPSEAVRWL